MIIKNKTDSILEFNNLGFSLLANEEKDISQIVEDCKHDNTFLHYIGSSRLSIINGTIELFTSEALNFLYTQNDNLTSYIEQEISNGNLYSGDTITDYNTMGIFKLNKGHKVTITRIDESTTSTFEDRYLILISSLKQ